MRKRLLFFALAVLLLAAPLLSSCQSPAPAEPGPSQEPGQSAQADTPADSPADAGGEVVELTMGSWRTDDVEQMNNLLEAYSKVNPNVKITFQPTNPPDYNATLRLQLDSGTGPDLMYARSYATGIELYDAGYFADCSDLPGIKDNFSADALAPWTANDGAIFAVPFAAVSHAVYYNKDVFAKEGLTPPTTWDEFVTICKTLKDKGYTPLANGLADEWDVLECFFLGMLPNYIGGADQRVLYESGEKKLNDEKFVQAYTDIASLAPYLPEGFEAVTYNDSQVMFNSQQAVMFMDGSWTAGVYSDAPFEWGVFSIPARNAADTAMCFHYDMAITMNTASAHAKEAADFLSWLCTEEGATTASQNLPVGYYPVIKFPIALEDEHANEFLALNEGKVTDVRFVWPKLMDLYAPMNQAVINVIKGSVTPQEAADSVAAAFK